MSQTSDANDSNDFQSVLAAVAFDLYGGRSSMTEDEYLATLSEAEKEEYREMGDWIDQYFDAGNGTIGP